MMHRIGMTVLGVLWCCLAAQESWGFSASYDQKITSGRDVIKSHVTIKDNLMRMEMTIAGQTSTIIRNQQGTFNYMPKERMAIQLPALSASQEPVQHTDDYEAYLRERNAKRLRSATIKGRKCDVYQFTDPAIQEGPMTVWVWKEKSFPIKMEMDGPNGKMTIILSNIQLGESFPDSLFELPRGIKVMNMESMMK